ncbi:hypothetical protein RHMOL_Rhmol08G0238000 [Rhododendron molle]|uniref:Uncharacterized protein n=2 Tax=Rhododendron molle TaxID=49168 RepID=A0ACC0MRZ5_RHOML|nr:hypothetical protein RHMOL_Rhmol08G0238000 [Rhododendron molle]KAI8543691.1 hypothetical protein RHMOL_Rhmol08G0238000 [Rhododendron molle]
MTAVAATARRSRRPSQNQPPTDKGLDVAVPDGSDSLMKRKRSAQNDGNGKQKKARPALLGRIMTRSALQQQQLEKEETRRIQESRGLDVAAAEGSDSLKKRKRSAQNDGNGKQKESYAYKQQQVERKLLLREEIRRIKERRGFDFGAVPPMMGIIDGLDDLDGSDEPCWAESSLYPAPKVYEDLAKIGLKSYNCQLDTSYQLTKILRVYFREHEVDLTVYNIFFQAEDKSVASPGDFIVVVGSSPNITVVSSCTKEKDRFGSLASCRISEYYIGRDRNLR